MYVAEVTSMRKYKGPIAIRGPLDVEQLKPVKKLKHAQREHFLILLLNARHECMRIETISIGSLNASIVHPREVFRPAVIHSAASIICVHNHPSGDPDPSEEDISISKRLVQCGELLGIGVLDSCIVGKYAIYSMRAHGQL